MDACACCKVCAKVKGEVCRGPWGTEGNCDKGFYCKTSGRDNWHEKGVCKPLNKQKGERCGGPEARDGDCVKGLYCHREGDIFEQLEKYGVCKRNVCLHKGKSYPLGKKLSSISRCEVCRCKNNGKNNRASMDCKKWNIRGCEK